MPKDTFFRLPEEKRTRILNAAKQEFFHVPYDEASINKIIKNAEIPRGSFYQYFEDKRDIFLYVLSSQHEVVINNLQDSLKKNQGDIFRLIEEYIDKGEKTHISDHCEQILNAFMKPETFCVINGLIQGEQGFNHMEEELEKFFMRNIDFSLYQLQGEEEERLFVKILGAVLRDNMRKMICGDRNKMTTTMEVFEQLRKQMQLLKNHFCLK